MSETSILSLLGKIAEEVGKSEETSRAEIEHWKRQARERVGRDYHSRECKSAALLGWFVGFVIGILFTAAVVFVGQKILGG